MTTFQELDAYLNQEFSDDYWYDDAKFYACELVKQLTTDDWNALKSSWRNRSKQWQERCAEILDWGDARQAVPLLLEMIQVKDDELTLTAADSLRSIGVAELDLPVAKDVLERLHTVAQTGNTAKRIINELLGGLQFKIYHNFLMEVMQVILDDKGDLRVVDQLLEANVDLLDDELETFHETSLQEVLRIWATSIFSTLPAEKPEPGKRIAAVIAIFSNQICQLPLGNRASHLEIAITGYEVVSRVFTRQAFPQQWAAVQNNLGNAYYGRIRGERAANLEAAIRCYLAALEEYTHEQLLEERAGTQNNLGEAYRNRIEGDRSENLEAAIRCFLAALEVRTREAFPQYYAETQFNLGLAYQDARQFSNAYNAFAAAINMVESLRGDIVSEDEAKKRLAEESNLLYQSIVEVCLELHNYAKAIEYIERSQAYNLAELLADRNLYPEGNIPIDILKEINRLRRKITRTPQLIDMQLERMRRGILTWKSG
jgi:tetratricopeptide (TPR) repeat protein